MPDWISDELEIENLPPIIAKIVNAKEGEKIYDENPVLTKKYFDNSKEIVKRAESIPKEILKTYKPKNSIAEYPEKQMPKFECDRLWFGKSSKYNLDRLVYAWMFREIYKNKSSIGCIIEETSRIYSWASYIQGYYKANHILWFQIRNIDEKHSYLKFQFNKNNIKEIYREYLNAVAYCIDNGLSK